VVQIPRLFFCYEAWLAIIAVHCIVAEGFLVPRYNIPFMSLLHIYLTTGIGLGQMKKEKDNGHRIYMTFNATFASILIYCNLDSLCDADSNNGKQLIKDR
jgi:hypothetical protein